MNDIIVNPEYSKIIEEIKELKENITVLYEERDELLYHICKNIELEYMSKLGVLEYKIYEFQIKILRIKRKIELYRIKINRQEIPNEEEIEQQLINEYAEYEKKLEQMSKNIEQALDRGNGRLLSEKEKEELKRIYRNLIKKLHPDLSKDESEKNKSILLQVTRAYENGDLETLKNLELLTDEIIEKEYVEIGEMEELKLSKERYQNVLNVLIETIKKIKDSFPYNKQEFLKNDILVQKRKDELELEMERCKEVYKELDDMLNHLKGGKNV